MPSFCQQCTLTLPGADKILYKLSKHFALKIAVSFDDTQAHLQFSAGICQIRREGDVLQIQCCADTSETLAQISDIVASHLALMARDPALNPVWTTL